MDPGILLGKIHQIEADLGRVRTIHWGPRTLDIDILLMEGVMSIPHVKS